MYRFADKYSFGKRAPTSYQGNKGTGELYLLETLVFWAKWEQQYPKQGFAPYFQAARKQQAGNVTVADRQVNLTTAGPAYFRLPLVAFESSAALLSLQDLKAFLTGAIQTSQYIRQPEINLAGLPLQQQVHRTARHFATWHEGVDQL